MTNERDIQQADDGYTLKNGGRTIRWMECKKYLKNTRPASEIFLWCGGDGQESYVLCILTDYTE